MHCITLHFILCAVNFMRPKMLQMLLVHTQKGCVRMTYFTFLFYFIFACYSKYNVQIFGTFYHIHNTYYYICWAVHTQILTDLMPSLFLFISAHYYFQCRICRIVCGAAKTKIWYMVWGSFIRIYPHFWFWCKNGCSHFGFLAMPTRRTKKRPEPYTTHTYKQWEIAKKSNEKNKSRTNKYKHTRC